MATYKVNWTLDRGPKGVHEAGEKIELTDAEFKALNGSAVVTKMKSAAELAADARAAADAAAAEEKRLAAEAKAAEKAAADKAAAEAAAAAAANKT